MKPGESLRDFKYRVKRHSDQLLSLKVAENVQEQQIEQDLFFDAILNNKPCTEACNHTIDLFAG